MMIRKGSFLEKGDNVSIIISLLLQMIVIQSAYWDPLGFKNPFKTNGLYLIRQLNKILGSISCTESVSSFMESYTIWIY